MDQGVLTQPEPAAHFPFPTSTADLTLSLIHISEPTRPY